jgi:hypothetical protein
MKADLKAMEDLSGRQHLRIAGDRLLRRIRGDTQPG